MPQRFYEFLDAVSGHRATRLPQFVLDMLDHIGRLEVAYLGLEVECVMAICGPYSVDANGAPL